MTTTSMKNTKKQKKKKISSAISKFLIGLSHQIPKASLESLLSNHNYNDKNDSIQLLLERSVEALPMGSPIRNYIGEHFQECFNTFLQQLIIRNQPQEPPSKKDEPSPTTTGTSIHSKEFPIVIFSNHDYNEQQQLKEDSSSSSLLLQPLLACTDFATPTTLKKIIDTTNPKNHQASILSTFRSFVMSGHFHHSRCSKHIKEILTMFISSCRTTMTEDGDKVQLTTNLRDFFHVYTIANAMIQNTTSSFSNDKEIAYKLGEVWGYCIKLAIHNPVEYYQSCRSVAEQDESDSSSSDSDDGDKRKRKRQPKICKDMAKKAAKNDIIMNLSLCLIQNQTMASCTYIGIMDVLERLKPSNSDKKGVDYYFHQAADVIVSALLSSNILTKKQIPSSKMVHSGEKRLRILLSQWANKHNHDFTDMIGGGVTISDEVQQKTTFLPNTTLSNPEESEEDSDSEEDDDNNDTMDASKMEHHDEQQQREPLFVLDTSPVIDNDTKDEEEEEVKDIEMNEENASSSDNHEFGVVEVGDNPDEIQPTENEAEHTNMDDKPDEIQPTENEAEHTNKDDKPDETQPTENETGEVDESAKDTITIAVEEEKEEEVTENDEKIKSDTPFKKKKDRRKSHRIQSMPTSSLLELIPIPEEDIVEAPDVTNDMEETVDEVLLTRTPAKSRPRSDSITQQYSDDDTSVTMEYSVGGTPLRRSSRKRRSTIRSMEAQPKTPSPKKKSTPKPSTRQKAKAPSSKKKSIDSTTITTPVRRSSRIRRNSESSTGF